MAGRQDFEERKERKIERYQERTEKATYRSKTHYKNHDRMASFIPFGQPILVGHHSENRHRRDLDKIHNEMGKAIKEGEKAAYYADKIETINNNKAISSDDPKVIEKLETKLKNLEEQKAKIKAKKERDCYELPYINRDIKAVKNRIKEIKELENLDLKDITFDGGKLIVNKEINRVQFIFDDIPSEEIRTILKSNGFKWSRYEGAWQRLYNANGIYSGKYVIKKINNLEK